jgi:glycosyltransferase involved in cell wall biosynthesis
VTHVVERLGSTRVELPAYDVHVLRPRRSRHALTVFVLNEGERIRSQLVKMTPLAGEIDIIVVDGGSTDGALDGPYLAECGIRALLVKSGPGGLSAQMRVGLYWCLEQGYEGIVTIDGNDKDDSSAVPSFVAALESGADHVQGSRYVDGGRGVRTPVVRHLGVMLVHAPLISMAAGAHYTDTTNGFRAYSARLLRDPRVQPFRDIFQHYELHYYLAIRAARLGFRVAELPVTRSYPVSGSVPSKITGWRGNLAILGMLWRAVRGQFDPPPESRA